MITSLPRYEYRYIRILHSLGHVPDESSAGWHFAHLAGADLHTGIYFCSFCPPGIYRTNLAAAGGMPTSPELIRMEVAITQGDFNARLKQVWGTGSSPKLAGSFVLVR
jgi:hypothetical protein